MWRVASLLALASAQDYIRLNGFQWNYPTNSDFNYFQGGDDWKGHDCGVTTVQESPINIQENPTDGSSFQVVSEDDLYFNPIVVHNEPIGDNFILRDAFGTLEFFVMAGTAHYSIPPTNDMTLHLLMFHVLAPAENLFNGRRYDLELHLYYGLATPSLQLRVLSIMGIWFEEAEEENPVLAQIIQRGDFDLRPLFPESGVLDDYFYYTGSEDRPFPVCYVSQAIVIPNYVLGASRAQIDYFNDMYMNNATFAGGRGNIRNVQPTRSDIYHFVSNHTRQPTFDSDDTIVSFLQ